MNRVRNKSSYALKMPFKDFYYPVTLQTDVSKLRVYASGAKISGQYKYYCYNTTLSMR